MVGCYRLNHDDVPFVPVLAHQSEAFERFVERARDPARFRAFETFFRDLPEPRPPHEHLKALRECVGDGAFEFLNVELGVGPQTAVERIREAGALTEEQLLEIMSSVYEDTPARHAYRSARLFREEVERLLAEPVPSQVELPPPESDPSLPKLPQLEPRERPLKPILARVGERAHALLPADMTKKLGKPPPIRWTAHVIGWAYGYHLGPSSPGGERIMINRLLCAPREAVSDGLLEFLCWHELLPPSPWLGSRCPVQRC